MILRAQSADGPGAASAPISFTTRAFTEPDAVLAVHPIVSATRAGHRLEAGRRRVADHGLSVLLDGGAWAPVTIQSENAKTFLFNLLPLPEVGDHTIALRAANAVGSGAPEQSRRLRPRRSHRAGRDAGDAAAPSRSRRRHPTMAIPSSTTSTRSTAVPSPPACAAGDDVPARGGRPHQWRAVSGAVARRVCDCRSRRSLGTRPGHPAGSRPR